jgi:hypothetical protein
MSNTRQRKKDKAGLGYHRILSQNTKITH